jgi:predicted RNase H-like nuclease (RuvC/YqgF family)
VTDNNEVFFDDNAGISIEEQNEILSTINGIAEKNRRSLAQGITEGNGKNVKINARKSGAFFPLVVNICACLFLCAGAFFLFSFNRKTDEQARTGSAVYNITERALIEEIRKDTSEKIAAKETEISSIASRLADVDGQLLQLHSSNQELTSEQLETQERLLVLQASYRDELAALQNERSMILENSRSKEAFLRAQLDERSREFNAVQQITSAELDSAMKELERLSGEQERVAAIDAQLAGGLVTVSALVQNGHREQASNTAAQLRNFLNNNTIASSRSFQLRKEFYNQSVSLAEMMINLSGMGAQNLSAGNNETELTEANAALEQANTELQKTVDALSSGSSGQASRLGQLEETVTTLRASISLLENSSAEKDRAISSLETERANLSRTNQTQEQEITNLRNQIAVIRELLNN